jgi:hypothetical protein
MAPLYFCRFGRKLMLVEDADLYKQARPRGTAGLWSHRNPTAWHCVCHQQRGQTVGHFDVSTVLLCCTFTVLHGPAIIIGVAQPQEPGTPTCVPLEEPFSHSR